MWQRLQAIQAQLAQVQQSLEETEVEASAGGAVRVVMTARPRLKTITISPEAVDPKDVEMLQDMIIAALNDALEKVRALQMEKLLSLAGGLGLSGLVPEG